MWISKHFPLPDLIVIFGSVEVFMNIQREASACCPFYYDRQYQSLCKRERAQSMALTLFF